MAPLRTAVKTNAYEKINVSGQTALSRIWACGWRRLRQN
jgi:hypothetical protein